MRWLAIVTLFVLSFLMSYTLSRGARSEGAIKLATADVMIRPLKPSALSIPSRTEPITSGKFKSFMLNRYQLPWDVLGLPKVSMHDMARATAQFYEMFDAISSKQDLESGEQGQQLQVLCSAFFMLLLSNTNKTAVTTTHVTNNNLTVQASHITVMQEMNGLKSALAQRTSQLEQWTFAWEENMKLIQSRHADQSDAINDLEAELIVMRERAKCAPPYFDAIHMFMRRNCIVGDEERVGSAELHAAFLDYVSGHQQLEFDGKPPTQREFRALLETLGFHYDQVYLRGSNIRGFRGLGIKHSVKPRSD